MSSIHIMLKPVSGACNLRCDYCFYADEAANRQTADCGCMDDATVETLIRKAFIFAEDGITFSFQGGEPLLAGLAFYERFVRTVGMYNVRGIPVSYALQTNGTLLTDALCRFFVQHDFLVGVSLDGTAATHDLHRRDAAGQPTHAAVLRGIRLLRRHGVEFNILCVLTNAACEQIPAVWQALAPFGHVQFIPCLDPLDAHGAHLLDADRYGEALVTLFDLYRDAFFTAAHVSERRMDNYLSILLGYLPESCDMAGKCGTYFLCEADGSVYPCDFYALDAWRLGNIRETSFARMLHSDASARFCARGDELPADCRACEYLFLCRGGCRRDREPDYAVSRYCMAYKTLFERRLPAMRALAAKAVEM